MALLSSTNKFFMIVGIKALPQQFFPSFLSRFHLLINGIHVSFAIISLVSYAISILCFLLFDAKSFTQFSEAGMFYMVALLHLSFYSISVAKRSKIFQFLHDLSTVVEKRSEQDEIRSIYSAAHASSETFANYLWNSMLISAELFIFPSAFVSYYKYFVLGLAENSFQLTFPATFIWDWKTPWGFLAAFCLQCYWIHCVIVMIIGTISLFSKLFMLLAASALDIVRQFEKLNAIFAETDQGQPNKRRIELRRHLIHIIEFHAVTRKFMESFMDCYGAILTTYFGLLLMILCTTLLGLNAAIYIGVVDFVRLFICLIITMTYISVLCMFGDETTTRFEEVHGSILRSPWNECPLDLQQLFPIILMVAQKPVHLRGYMSVKCTREFMKTVTNNGFSYFMMLRQFNR